MNQGGLYEHHVEGVDRNKFYGEPNSSTLTTVLNQDPSAIKIFNTLNYEGTQSKIKKWEQKTTPSDINILQSTINNVGTYNHEDKLGWFVDYIQTDKQVGTLREFLQKEGKWFNYVRGTFKDSESLSSDFSFQGLGMVETTEVGSLSEAIDASTLSLGSSSTTSNQGTTNTSTSNY